MYISERHTAAGVLGSLIHGAQIMLVDGGEARKVSLDTLKLPVRVHYTRTDGKSARTTIDDYKVALAIRKAQEK